MESQRELTEALLQFVSLVESERKLLAADLHDQTLSDLGELARQARLLAEAPVASRYPDLRDRLLRIVAGLDAAMDEVRRVMERLSPSALDTLGFLPALESCLARASSTCAQPSETRFTCLVGEDHVGLSETEQLLLYRIVQEALNNIAKHAAASSIELLITRHGGDLLIRVTDDGRGMTSSGDLRRARGLENMRYRAKLIGAQLTWLRATGERGTVVEIRVPERRGDQ